MRPAPRRAANAALAWLAAAAACAGVGGCFPYRQAYRPELAGVVLDPAQRPVAGAEVVACTTDGWEPARGCPRRAEARTDAGGRFRLPPHREWAWCCLGEAPRPRTAMTSCALDRDGTWLQAPSAVLGAGGGAGATDLRLQLAPVRPAAPPSCQP